MFFGLMVDRRIALWITPVVHWRLRLPVRWLMLALVSVNSWAASRGSGGCYIVVPEVLARSPGESPDGIGAIPLDLFLIAAGAQAGPELYKWLGPLAPEGKPDPLVYRTLRGPGRLFKARPAIVR